MTAMKKSAATFAALLFAGAILAGCDQAPPQQQGEVPSQNSEPSAQQQSTVPTDSMAPTESTTE